MTSEYNGAAPTPDLLHLGSMPPTSAFGVGGSPSGSDYGFGTPQSLSLDTRMHHGGNGGMATAADATRYPPAPAVMPSNIQNFSAAFDPSMRPSPSMQGGSLPRSHRTPTSTFQDTTSPAIGSRHRLSISSNGPYALLDRQHSMADSDTTSPGAHVLGGGVGENPFGGNSNDTAHLQAQGEEEEGDSKLADTFSGAPPPWSEMKTKAGKERKRLPLACIACRRKKIRCSGEKPACKHCLRSRIPCVYKVTARKAAPRTDYMAMLDKRLKRMEERVIRIIPKEEQGVVTNTGRAVLKPALPPPPPKPSSASKKRGAEQAFGDELDDWANPAPVSAANKDDVQGAGESTQRQAHDAEEHSLLLEGSDKLPRKELQEHLTEVFFDYVYGQSYHLLHKPSFLRKLAQGTVPPVLMLAICGISARFSSHPAVRTEPAFLRGDSWAGAARDIALRRYDTPNTTILIVYLILGLHEFGTCQGGRSWMFGGMAQRMAYALQLHKDLDHDPKLRRNSDGKNGEGDLTFTDREIRRRTMWSCFLMDRFNSSGTDRPMFVAEQYIRAQLPIKENYYQMEITGPTEDLDGHVPNPVAPDTGQVSDARENMGVAAYLIRLVAIWGKLVHYLNLGGKERDKQPMWAEDSTFQQIWRDTKQWTESLPPSLLYTPENLQTHASEKIANQFLFMHIVYNQVILFSNRFALPTAGVMALPKDVPSEFVLTASRAALDAANQISALIGEAMDHQVVAPFAGYCAFLSSTVHIQGAFSKNEQLQASSKQNLACNVKYLTKMKKYWGMFHFVTENLRELYRQHADAARSDKGPANGGSATGGGQDAAIFQYGDWFDRYPHGVSGTDYEEPSAEVKKEAGSDAVLGQRSDLQTVEEFFSKLSPPSRAAHLQQQQQKKAPKKRRASRSEGKQVAAAATTDTLQQQQQPDAPAHAFAQPGSSGPQMRNHLLAGPQGFDHLDAMRQHSIAFPPGFQPPPNPLLANAPQHMMSQLDRQMVLNSYAGLDHTNPAHAFLQQQQQLHHNAMLGQAHNSLDPFQHLDAFSPATPHTASGTLPDTGNGAAAAGAGVWGDPSSAWFMPFNMEPPSIGEDSNLFTHGGANSFDWTNFGGFGELPSGLTPQGVPGDGGLDRLGGSSSHGAGGLDGFEGM